MMIMVVVQNRDWCRIWLIGRSGNIYYVLKSADHNAHKLGESKDAQSSARSPKKRTKNKQLWKLVDQISPAKLKRCITTKKTQAGIVAINAGGNAKQKANKIDNKPGETSVITRKQKSFCV